MVATKRQMQKESTRKRIMEAAYAVYSKHGFSAATSLIASEAGVAHGSVFLHFPTQGDLLASLMAEFENTICSRFQELAGLEGSVEMLLDSHIGILSDYEDFYTISVVDMFSLPKKARESFYNLHACFSSHFNRVASREIENGVLKKLPVGILANAWTGLLHYYLQNKDVFAPEGGSVLKRYEKQLIFTYCEMMRRQ